MWSIEEQTIKSNHKVVMYTPKIVGGQVGKLLNSMEFCCPNPDFYEKIKQVDYTPTTNDSSTPKINKDMLSFKE